MFVTKEVFSSLYKMTTIIIVLVTAIGNGQYIFFMF